MLAALRELHDELDAAVLRAYGLPPLAGANADTDAILTYLVALNTRRAAEEAAGTVRWLRPAFQNAGKLLSKSELSAQVQQGLDDDLSHENSDEIDSNSEGGASAKQDATHTLTAGSTTNAPALKALATPALTAVQPWPATLPEQVRAVAQVLAISPAPLSVSALEAHFKGRGPWKKGLPMLLQTLEALGRAQPIGEGDAVAWRA